MTTSGCRPSARSATCNFGLGQFRDDPHCSSGGDYVEAMDNRAMQSRAGLVSALI